MEKVNIFWFRRDLRLVDNVGLYHALKSSCKVLPIFIFDTMILDKLENKKDARVNFIFDTVQEIKSHLNALGADLEIHIGTPEVIWTKLVGKYQIDSVFANHDFESYGTQRDKSISAFLASNGIHFLTFKDHVIFEKFEIVKDDGLPYTVFTPYKKKWLAKLSETPDPAESPYLMSVESEAYLSNLLPVANFSAPMTLQDIGFEKSEIPIPTTTIKQSIIANYDVNRDFPALDATSKLGIHFRFGTISIREKAAKAFKLNATFLSELIWRDFYHAILFHFPHVEKNAFRPEYDQIEWLNDETAYKAWCQGKTGYPIVDAGMRELLATGHMHNRVRMITASFLTKHLLIDWRWGESWFAAHLLDFDLASNNGGWQWAAGCGTDAVPYFRIFSPDAQTERFDKEKTYIKRWVPEFGTKHYIHPIVDHKSARERCLTVYKTALARS